MTLSCPLAPPAGRPLPPSFPSPVLGELPPYTREPQRKGTLVEPWIYHQAPRDEVLYLVGPGVTSWPDSSDALAHATANLRAAGYTVFSHQDVWGASFPFPPLYRAVKRACLEALLQVAERVVLIEGWQDCTFAHVQIKVAQALGLPISDYDAWEATGLWLDMSPFVLYHLFERAPQDRTPPTRGIRDGAAPHA